MTGIIRKDYVIYLVFVLIFTAVQVFSYRFSSFGHLAYSVTMFSFLCFLVSTLPAISNEYTEKMNRGYSLLKTLPVTDGEIVFAKFGLMLAATVLYTTVTLIGFRFLPASAYELRLAQVWLVMNAAVGMTIAGLIMTMAYRFGMSTMLTVLSVGLGGVVAGYIATAELLARGRFDHLLPHLERAARAGAAPYAVAGLAAWFVLMRASTIVKRRYHDERV
jgi:hypothetical protein